jgi:hypothetical protein
MFKLTDINAQRLRVVSTRTGEEKIWNFDLSGLTLSEE